MTLDMGEVIDFRLFVETISIFNDRVSAEEKFKYFFRIYDMDGDGFVGDSELYVIFRMLVGASYNEFQIQSIADQIIQQYDKDKDNKLNFKEFSMVLADPELSFLMS